VNDAHTAAAAADTRSQILRVAGSLIRTRSYLGFSFQDIADEIGIRKPSLYHHFTCKQALGVEVLRQATAAFEEWAATTPTAPRRKLTAYFNMYRNGLHAGHGVCPAGALACGWDCIDAELRAAVRCLRDAQISWLKGVLSAIGMRGRKHSTRATAAFVFAACQGALLSARMTGAVGDFDAAVAQARTAVLTDATLQAGSR
jgi:TetR/AcrR family transcriptional regulator, transcriptional repressor for nem operon